MARFERALAAARKATAAVLLSGVGALLLLTSIPGVYIIDEDNYLVTLAATRQLSVTVPGTEGLPPTNALLWFEPTLYNRRVDATPVPTTAPPLWAVLAAPVAPLGWRGFVALNVLGWVVTGTLLFSLARRHARSAWAPWIGVAAFAAGSHALEYAQGLWPHLIATGLLIAAYSAAGRAREGASARGAAVAGLLAGIACGVRYPSALVAAGIGAGFLLAPRRGDAIRGAFAYAAGLAPPLAVTAVFNRLRFDSWNPLSKGPGYYRMGRGHDAASSPFVEAARVFWAKVVDFSTHPPLGGRLAEVNAYLSKEPTTGAVQIGDGVKKAWLQSSPWVGLALLAAVAALIALLRPSRWRTAPPGDRAAALARERAAAALVLLPPLAIYALAGFARIDGLCLNQRYFLELIPYAALLLALAIDVAPARPADTVAAIVGTAGAIAGTVVVFSLPPSSTARVRAILDVPLVLAAALLVSWSVRRQRWGAMALPLLLGASIAWGAGVHLAEDLVFSRLVRARHAARLRAAFATIPERAALLAWWGNKDAYGPLVVERSVVIADAWADRGASTPALVDAWLGQGRRVFIVPPFPAAVLDRALVGRRLVGGYGWAPSEIVAGDAVPAEGAR